MEHKFLKVVQEKEREHFHLHLCLISLLFLKILKNLEKRKNEKKKEDLHFHRVEDEVMMHNEYKVELDIPFRFQATSKRNIFKSFFKIKNKKIITCFAIETFERSKYNRARANDSFGRTKREVDCTLPEFNAF